MPMNDLGGGDRSTVGERTGGGSGRGLLETGQRFCVCLELCPRRVVQRSETSGSGSCVSFQYRFLCLLSHGAHATVVGRFLLSDRGIVALQGLVRWLDGDGCLHVANNVVGLCVCV